MRCPMLRLSLILAAATALAPPQGLLLGVGRVAEAHPLVFGSGLTCLKTVCSDVLVQKRVQKRKALNYRRCGVFAIYGFFYLGAVQYLRSFKNAFDAFSIRTGSKSGFDVYLRIFSITSGFPSGPRSMVFSEGNPSGRYHRLVRM